MKILKSFFALNALVAANPLEYASNPSLATAKAVYFMSNIDKANSVHALPVMADGTVGHGTVTPTGGKGSRAPSKFGLTDALNSQGSVAILDNYLFVVNAGSDTISMLEINRKDPLKLKLVAQPVNTIGNWPNSVVVSKELKLACVGNTGTQSGIACFKITSSGLQVEQQPFRNLPLYPRQTIPPSGPFNTVSQLFFSEDRSALYSTVKGTPLTNASNTGYLASYPIKNGVVSTTGTLSSPNGTAVLFGSVALLNRHILATDASFGAALLKVSKSGIASTLNKVTIPNNSATCWAALSPSTGLLYTTDDGNNQIGAFDPSTGNLVHVTELNNGIPNIIEITAVGDLLYALSHGNKTVPPHVIVMKVLGAGGRVKTIQKFSPGGVGINVEGMAALMN